MQVTSRAFKQNAARALANAQLQAALGGLRERFVQGRAAALADLGHFEEWRQRAAAIRDQALAELDQYLERFEQAARAAGAEVHWAADAEGANRILLDIARRHDVARVVKSKSMVSEECGVNDALEAAGLTVTETDLGEYILQLAHEPPSHIVAPVVHKSKDEVSDLFERAHRSARKTGIDALCREAREVLRPRFLDADLGLTGANFIVAETGSVVIVTNEGNGRLVTTLPRVHVAITGIEKVVPTLDDVATLLRLLPRSATGQSITNYVSVLTGPRRASDSEGPTAMHVILLDNGRSDLLKDEFRTMLRCIRCGACLNHCPIYQNVGGHAYGWVYPGPMGAVLTPAFLGHGQAPDLPNASTLCGACGEVCPVNIPLPDLLRRWRERQTDAGARSFAERATLRVWAYVAARPRLYHALARVSVRTLKLLTRFSMLIRRLPGLGRWLAGRDLPPPEGFTFQEWYRAWGKRE